MMPDVKIKIIYANDWVPSKESDATKIAQTDGWLIATKIDPCKVLHQKYMSSRHPKWGDGGSGK